MILKDLNLKGTFCHLNTEVEFKEGINLILGENGSGKTSLIEAIYLALYNDTFKAKKLKDIGYFGEKCADITLNTDRFKIVRRYLRSPQDFLVTREGQKIEGRERCLKYIEQNIAPKKFFQHIIYTAQGRLLDIVEMTNSERNEFLNYILNLDYITDFVRLVTKSYNTLDNHKKEVYLLLKKIESSKIEQKKELIESLKETEKKLETIEKEIEKLEKDKEALEFKKLYYEKEKIIKEYAKLRKVYFKYKNLKEELKQKSLELQEIKHKRNLIEKEMKDVQKTIDKFKNLLKEKKCPYCEREIDKVEYEKYENLLLNLNQQLLELSESFNQINTIYKKLKYFCDNINKKLQNINLSRYYNEIVRLRIKANKMPSIHYLKQYKNFKVENEELLIKNYEEMLSLKERLEDYKKSIKWQLDLLQTEKKMKEYKELQERKEKIENLMEKLNKFKKVTTEQNLAGELRWQALKQSNIEQIYKVFDLGNLDYDKNFNLYVDGIPIYACSGSQKVAAVLAIKLALLGLYKVDFIILDEPTIYLDKKRIEDLKQMLVMIYEKKFVRQILLISHIDSFTEIANHIIKIKKDKQYSEIIMI